MAYVAYMIEVKSTITSYDYVSIVAGMMRVADNELDCSSCTVKYPQKERQAQHQKNKGCFGPTGSMTYMPKYEMEGSPRIRFKRCPAYFADNSIYSLRDDYELYRKGIMPFDGGHYDMPAKFHETMGLVGNMLAEERSELEALKARYGKRC